MFSDWVTLQTQELKVAIEAEGTRSGSRRDKVVAQVKLFQKGEVFQPSQTLKSQEKGVSKTRTEGRNKKRSYSSSRRGEA